MATLNSNNQDQQQNINQASGAPVTVSGTGAPSASGQGAGGNSGGGVGGGSASSAASVQQNLNPSNTAGYTDVGAYLNANQAGSQQLGNQVAGNLTNQYNTTKQGIDTSSQANIAAAGSGYTPENTQLIQQVSQNPTGASSSDISGYQSQLNDVYGGPQNWADYGTQQGNVNMAQQEAGLVNTPGGLNVLAQQVEQPTTSAGSNQLDTLLLGGSPGAMSTVQQAATPFTSLTDYLNSQNAANTAAISAGQTGAAQTSQDALNAFTGANGTLTNLNNAINTTTANDLTAAKTQQGQLKTDIANLYGGQAVGTDPTSLGTYGGGTTPWYNTTNYNVGQLSPQDLASMGMTQDQWTALQGAMGQAGTSQMMNGHNFGAGSGTSQIDLSQYLTQQDPTAAINAGTVATPDQYTQMGAIQNILGSQMPQGAAINPAMASQAGTYNPNALNTFNYNAALTGAQGTAQSARDAAQAEANAISGAADVAHADSQHGGGFLGGLKQDITHPLQTITALNPMSWGANAQNLINGKQVGGQYMDPLHPTQSTLTPAGAQQTGKEAAIAAALAYSMGSAAPAVAGGGTSASTAGGSMIAGAAHGGEVQDVESYLDKKKGAK